MSEEYQPQSLPHPEAVESDSNADAEVWPEPLPFTADPVAESFFAGAAARIRRLVPILGAVLAVAAWTRFGARVALGFAVGAVIAGINYRWMERGISGLLDRVVESGDRASGPAVFLRFLSRFGLILGAAYATLSSSRGSLYGFLAGLFVPVAAILCEAVYEAWAALRRGL